LSGWNALRTDVGSIGATQVLDLDGGPDVKGRVLTRRTRVRHANVGIIVATD
jgi:hypothetical protein